MNDDLKISAEGVELVKHFEGLYLTAYLCPARVWTIGYGHTGLTHKDGTVKAGRVITHAEAEKLLKHDLTAFENRVKRLVKVDIYQHEFDALVSFDFNTGALGRSTLLKWLNKGKRLQAGAEFLKWTRGGGRVLPGLVRRRRAERAMFLGEIPDFK
jgi:lysozyme